MYLDPEESTKSIRFKKTKVGGSKNLLKGIVFHIQPLFF